MAVSPAGLCALLAFLPGAAALQAGAAVPVIPLTRTNALDEHPVTLPRDLTAPATVLILGFGRNSKDATTAWERPVRSQIARPGAVGFFDMAMLAEVPAFVRPLVLRSMKHAVPDVLKPNFLALTADEDSWKQVAGYASDQPEAAYVLVVDHTGGVHWSTHVAFSPAAFAELRRQVEALSSANL